jgi:cysteinyl-tRNA synthetase
MTGIFLYNTLARAKEEIVPREPGKVSLYVCGVTPYDALHIGHARAFTVYDVLRRVLETRGLQVHHVQNVTDIDDKIINRAREVGKDALALAQEYSDQTLNDLRTLNILPAHDYPRVTQHIAPIIEMTSSLEGGGYAYSRGGDVYFDVSRDDDYGKLSNQKIEELEAGARIEPGEHKDDPLDFALWKKAKPGEPSWDSPWGKGRPGWHIECSAMALEILGPGFDIHGGARELMFPHHENEVAQSESYLAGKEANGGHAHDTTFAKIWWHCGVVQVDGKKMSKSLGNFLTVRDALKLADTNVWRLLFLMTHPRSPLDYSDEKMAQTKSAWARLQTALLQVGSTPGTGAAAAQSETAAREFRAKFDAALNDDLNTPIALAAVFDAVADWRRGGQNDAALLRAARAAMEVLGFSFEKEEALPGDTLAPGLIELLIHVRETARERRDFQTGDVIRDEMKALGIALEDTPTGTRWKLEN